MELTSFKYSSLKLIGKLYSANTSFSLVPTSSLCPSTSFTSNVFPSINSFVPSGYISSNMILS